MWDREHDLAGMLHLQPKTRRTGRNATILKVAHCGFSCGYRRSYRNQKRNSRCFFKNGKKPSKKWWMSAITSTREMGESNILMDWRAKLEKEPTLLEPFQIDEIIREVRQRLSNLSR